MIVTDVPDGNKSAVLPLRKRPRLGRDRALWSTQSMSTKDADRFEGSERIPCPKGCGEYKNLIGHWSQIHDEPFPDDTPRMADKTRRKISESVSGENHPLYGKTLSREHKQKISEKTAGKTLSEEHKQKISEANSGENHPFYGKSLPEEHRQKISESGTGRTFTKEHREKLSKAHTGKTFSEDHRQNLSKAKSGENHPMYGKSLSEEHRQNISKGNSNPSEKTRQKKSDSLTGRTFTKEHRKNLSEALSGESHPFYGKTHSEETKRKMSESMLGEKHHFHGKSLSEEHRQKLSDSLMGGSLSEEHIRSIIEGQNGELGVVPTKHTVRSGWERDIDLLLYDAGLDFEYEPEVFEIGDGRKYVPDFRVGDNIIEVKGHNWRDADVRAELFMDAHPEYRYIVIGNGDIPCDIHFNWKNREGVLEVL